MTEKHTAIHRIEVTAGCTVPVKVDVSTHLDRRNGQLLKAGQTVAVTIDQGTAGEVTLSNKQINTARVWIDPKGQPPRLSDVGEVVEFDATFAASLTNAVYRAKIVVVDANDKSLPAKFVLFVVETGETS